MIAKLAKRHGVRIYRIVNAGNHLHITLKLSKQFTWKGNITKDYLTLNQLEADGVVPPRSKMLRPERWRCVVLAFS